MASRTSRRARPSVLRAWDLAGEAVGLPPQDLVAEELSATFRSLVWRFRPAPQPGVGETAPQDEVGAGGVVVKFFRRRDGAVNSGGFGYLRARWGAEVLPGAAAVLAHDDAHRLLVCEDLASPTSSGTVRRPLVDVVDEHLAAGRTEDAASLVRSWMLAWPSLCVRPENPGFTGFCSNIAAADPVAEAAGTAGRLPSATLTGEDAELLTDPRHSVLWCGDMNPRNFFVDEGALLPEERGLDADPGIRSTASNGSRTKNDSPAGHEPLEICTGRTWFPADLEGTGFSDPALLVAEAALGLPSAPEHRRWAELIGPRRYRDIAEELSEMWQVSQERRDRGERALHTLLGALRG